MSIEKNKTVVVGLFVGVITTMFRDIKTLEIKSMALELRLTRGKDFEVQIKADLLGAV